MEWNQCPAQGSGNVLRRLLLSKALLCFYYLVSFWGRFPCRLENSCSALPLSLSRPEERHSSKCLGLVTWISLVSVLNPSPLTEYGGWNVLTGQVWTLKPPLNLGRGHTVYKKNGAQTQNMTHSWGPTHSPEENCQVELGHVAGPVFSPFLTPPYPQHRTLPHCPHRPQLLSVHLRQAAWGERTLLCIPTVS